MSAEDVGNVGKLRLLYRFPYYLVGLYMMQKLGLRYIKWLVYERPLDAKITSVVTKVPVVVKAVSIVDIKRGLFDGIRLASGDDPIQHNEALGRLCNGCLCYVATVNTNVVGFAWINFQTRKYESAIERVETFRSNEALIYDTFVLAKYRKNGIGSKLNESCLKYLRLNGYKRALVYINARNTPSINSFVAVNFRGIKQITFLKVFKFRRIKENNINGIVYTEELE